MAKLSTAQINMLSRLAQTEKPEESPYNHGHLSGRLASAWHRTAHSLKERGLVSVARYGDHYCVMLTADGFRWKWSQPNNNNNP